MGHAERVNSICFKYGVIFILGFLLGCDLFMFLEIIYSFYDIRIYLNLSYF